MAKAHSTAIMIGAASLLLPFDLSAAAEFNVAQGQRLARTYCAACHSVERSGASPMPIAPPFRTIARQLSEQRLRALFRTQFEVAHPTMPRFRLEPDQVTDLGAYFQSLK